MFTFRTLSYSLKSVLFKAHKCKCIRKISTDTNDFSDLLRSHSLKKYFKHIEENSVDHSYRHDVKFQIDSLIKQRKEVLSNLKSLCDLEQSSKEEKDFLSMVKEEKLELELQLTDLEYKLLDTLAPELPNSNEVIFEITAGVGGKEAMLFANDLHEMYMNYIGFKNWNINFMDLEPSDLGGLRHSSIFVEGQDVLSYLRHESGIHRVQRVPVTEKSGRIHTSTVSVAIFPMPSEIDVQLNEKDLHIETMRASGAGGQHVNKTESAVRITHIPTGIVAECSTDRSQIKNRKFARQKLCARLYEVQQREQTSSRQESRRSQVGTSARSDKIRTYNYPQDRVTDHRITKSLHNLPGFLEGGELLDSLINDLILFSEKERLNSFISSLNDQSESTS